MKKILILLGILVALFLAYSLLNFFYLTRLASPQEVVTYSENEQKVFEIEYCRPSKKGRLIFGSESEEALVPYGKYWRLGANQSTEISLEKDLSFGGEKLKKGRYKIYAIPGKESWSIVFNSELGKWGYSKANDEKDVLRLEISVEELVDEVEVFTITALLRQGKDSPSINFFWDRTLVSLPFQYE